MNEIDKIIERIKVAEKDVAEFEKLKEKAADDLLLIASPTLSVADAKTKILDARLTIDLADSKLKISRPKVREIRKELEGLLSDLAGTWNEAVRKALVSAKEKIIQQNLFAFNGKDADCRRWWADGYMHQMPVIIRLSDAFYPEECLRLKPHTGWTVEQVATHLIGHIKTHAARCGIETIIC